MALEAGLDVLGGLASSRLDNALVRGSEMAVSVTADVEQHEQIGFIEAQMDVKPGVDPAAAEKKFDAVIADLVKNGPTRTNCSARRRASSPPKSARSSWSAASPARARRWPRASSTRTIRRTTRKSSPSWRRSLPAKVKAALQKWLGRPAYTLTIKPGQRTENGALLGGWGDEGKVPPPPKDPKTAGPAQDGQARRAAGRARCRT